MHLCARPICARHRSKAHRSARRTRHPTLHRASASHPRAPRHPVGLASACRASPHIRVRTRRGEAWGRAAGSCIFSRTRNQARPRSRARHPALPRAPHSSRRRERAYPRARVLGPPTRIALRCGRSPSMCTATPPRRSSTSSSISQIAKAKPKTCCHFRARAPLAHGRCDGLRHAACACECSAPSHVGLVAQCARNWPRVGGGSQCRWA